MGFVISRADSGRCGKMSLSNGAGEGVFLVRTPGTWGEPMFAGGHFFSILVAGLVGGCPGWTISSDTPGNEGWSGREGQPPGSSGTKVWLAPAWEMERRGQPVWQLPVGRGLGPSWASSMHAFAPQVRGQDNRQLPVRAKVVLGSRSPIVPDSLIGMGRGSSSVVPRCP